VGTEDRRENKTFLRHNRMNVTAPRFTEPRPKTVALGSCSGKLRAHNAVPCC
jgi:hypothetical protein